MMIRLKHFALSIGYDIGTDCPYGFTLALGRRAGRKPGEPIWKFIVECHWDLPKLVWRWEEFAINEPGYVQGLPVPRLGIRSSAWTGREFSLYGIQWYRGFYWSWHG